jgi:hypothetical protein
MTFATLPKSIFGDLDELLLNEQPRPKRVFEQVSESPATTPTKLNNNDKRNAAVESLMSEYGIGKALAVDIVAFISVAQAGVPIDELTGTLLAMYFATTR